MCHNVNMSLATVDDHAFFFMRAHAELPNSAFHKQA
jgi:hypothetical protein